MNQYQLEEGKLCRFGSYEKFSRVLYGGHAHDDGPGRFFTFAGTSGYFGVIARIVPSAFGPTFRR